MTRTDAWRDLRGLVQAEFGLLKGKPKLWGACLVIMTIPSVYALTYLGSVWDPYAHFNRIPVALVNQDQGTVVQGRPVELGRSVLGELEATHAFAYRRYETPAAARLAVERGEAYFALLLPPTFSREAVAAEGRHPAALTVLASQGTSYMAATVAKRFGEEVAHGLNETLGENRWRLTGEGFDKLHAGVSALQSGAHQIEVATGKMANGAAQLSAGSQRAVEAARQLASGSHQVAGGVGHLTDGSQQLHAGIRLMASRAPLDSDLNRLSAGSTQVMAGARDLANGLEQLEVAGSTLAIRNVELAQGMDRLKQGSSQLAMGGQQYTAAVGRIPLLGGGLSAGSGKLQAGIERLDAGLGTASHGAGQLAEGAQRYRDGVTRAHQGAERLAEGSALADSGIQRLAGGTKQLAGGLRKMAQAFPPEEDLARLKAGSHTLAAKSDAFSQGLAGLNTGSMQLAEGADRLAAGTNRLSQGLDTLYRELPSGSQLADPQALARPVRSAVEWVAPVPNNGTAFAPYFIGLSLWMGAVMTAFLFHFIVLPESMRPTRQRHRMLAKGMLPSLIVTGQAIALAGAVRWALHLSTPAVGAYYLILITGAWTFVSIVMALILLLGDAGKLLAVVLLVVQLAAAGGAFPVEVSPDFYQWIHPFMPLTNLIKAFRASQFGAYAGAWWPYELRMLLAGGSAAATALIIGRRRWKFVPDPDYGPALDL